jgi:hypothetical protein
MDGDELDVEGGLANVGGYAIESESMEVCPAQESGVMGGEAAEEFGDDFLRVIGGDSTLIGCCLTAVTWAKVCRQICLCCGRGTSAF